MIEINLLPTRALKRKESVKQQAFIYLFLVLLTVAGLGGFWFITDQKTKRLLAEEESLKAQKAKLEDQVAKVYWLKQQQEELQTKLDIINALRSNRMVPVHVLKEAAMLLPAADAWIKEMNISGNQLVIRGVARDHQTIVKYIKDLEEKSDHLLNIQIIESKAVMINEVELKDFHVVGMVIPSGKMNLVGQKPEDASN